MNGLLNLIINAGHINKAYIDAHTTGFEELKKIVSKWTPERVEEVTGVPAAKVREAAEILGTTNRWYQRVLQGVYQSMQGTAAAVQINNLTSDTWINRKRRLWDLSNEWTTNGTKYPGVWS